MSFWNIEPMQTTVEALVLFYYALTLRSNTCKATVNLKLHIQISFYNEHMWLDLGNCSKLHTRNNE